MAIFRKIHTSFWSDSFISDLDKDKKMFYLYLLTNERTTQCGIYEITKRQIAFDLGYSIDTVSKLLEYFVSEKKIKYNEQTNEIAIKNWAKYNGSTSPKVKSCIDKELKTIKDTLLIQYIYGTDTSPQEEEEQEEEKKGEEEERNFPLYPEIEKRIGLNSLKPLNEVFNELDNNQQWKEAICMNHSIPGSTVQIRLNNLKILLNEFYNHLSGDMQVKEKSLQDTYSHFSNWLRKKKEYERK